MLRERWFLLLIFSYLKVLYNVSIIYMDNASSKKTTIEILK